MRIKSILLPPEHGGWSFLLEPIVLALLVAPSWRGAAVGAATSAVFLARQPLRRLLRNARGETGGIALVAATCEILTAAAFLVASIHDSSAHLVPLVVVMPLAVWQIVCDARNESRAAVAELLAPIALAAAAPSIAIAGGWSVADAGILWFLIVARSIPTVLYVRARLRGEKRMLPVVAHLVALLAVAALFRNGFAPLLAAVALFLLFVRATFDRASAPAKVIGVREIVHGATAIVLIAIGFRLSL